MQAGIQDLSMAVVCLMGLDDWLSRFHAGKRSIIEECYREHFDSVMQAVGELLSSADRETVVHEVFYRLLSDPGMRASFRGGSLRAWLRTVARNRAIDYLRRHRREQSLDSQAVSELQCGQAKKHDEEAEAKMLIDQFRSQHLPKKLEPVFEARFLQQLSQREAARKLKMRRTTLAYQEQQIRNLLRGFLLSGEES
jgi:RNA polymerase sigma-70 factor (ECF subfamily)